MTTPAKPRPKRASRGRTGTVARKLSARRPVERLSEPAGEPDSSPSRRAFAPQVEQVVILGLAIAFGLVGLAVHVLWLVSIVLMAVVFGLIAATLRGSRGRGVISEVAAEAKSIAADIASKDKAVSVSGK
jgi:hypothetical protein